MIAMARTGTQVRIDRLLERVGITRFVRMVDAKPITYRRATCTASGAHEDLRFPSDAAPEMVIKAFEQKGWEISQRTKCPACAKPKRASRAESHPEQNVVTLRQEPENMKQNTAQKPAEAVREPTLDEAAAIVKKLDECFEDGRYLDGGSDRKVGETLGLPWALVAKVREKFRGPIKEDPAVVSLRADIDRVEATVKELLKEEMKGLRERLAKLEAA
ncbi:hypothetical protein [Azospirillum canadense]|uniref:hypothetical protein n=1 Tax=Azospirillum canadense TaxID=403962 RepID=UPI002226C247|nr:hypothetical protein [Azospirillum canadense]MCW2242214.1 hypothetical protein [Azospirillum canadense]